jgi:NAD(P)H-hydrate epimerase
VINADLTISFQTWKLPFFIPENDSFIGKVVVVEIGLDAEALMSAHAKHAVLETKDILAILKPRPKHSHKGSYGRALLAGGSSGKIGAIRLGAEAALRVGAGTVTVYVPRCGLDVIQTSFPEAMVVTDPDKRIISHPPLVENYTAIGIGPGMGTAEVTILAYKAFLEKVVSPLVIDADAINILGLRPELQKLIPAGSVLTPHAREFRRLAGPSTNDFDALEKLRAMAAKLKSYIVFKGAFTCIATPDGECYFNQTGNPGMATAGSGDVLTGMIVGFMAQGYTALDACKIGVWIHGLAGDFAAAELGYEALLASDIIKNLGKAFLSLKPITVSQ